MTDHDHGDAAPESGAGYLRGAALFVAVALLLAGAMAVTFSYVLLADPAQISGRYDICRYFGPLTYYIDNRIAHGEFPFWNPLTYCGVPNTGNPQSFIFYPPNLLRSLLVGEPTPFRTVFSMCVMWALHLLFMGVSMFYLARAHRLSVAGSLAAAITLLCSALVVRRMSEFHFITTMAWLPAILLVVKCALDDDRLRAKFFYALGAGLLLGLSILGGFLQIVNLMGVTLGAYGSLYMLLPARAHGPILRRARIRGVAADLCCLVLVVVAGSFVAAATLVPAHELTAFTMRQQGMQTPLFSDLREWNVLRFFQALVIFPGMKYEPETIHLAGVVPILLAAMAITHRRRRHVALFALLCLVFLELSFGPPFPLSSVVEWLTPFSQSAYTRAWDFLMIPFAMLAGFGLDAATRPLRRVGSTVARGVFVVYLALLCLVPMLVWLWPHHYLGISSEVLIIPALAVVAILMASMIPFSPAGRRVFAGIILLCLFMETFAWNARYVPFLISKKFTEIAPIRANVSDIPLANTRDADPLSNRFLYSLRFAMNGVDPLHLAGVRDLLSGPPRDARPHRHTDNWEATRENHRGNLLFKRSFWLARQYCPGPLPGKTILFPAATTVFLEQGTSVALPEVPGDDLPPSGLSDQTLITPLSELPRLFRPIQGRRQVIDTIALELPRSLPGRHSGPSAAVHSALIFEYRSSVTGALEFWIDETGTDRSTHGKRQSIRNTGGDTARLEVPLPDYPAQQVRISFVPSGGVGEFQITEAAVGSDLADEDDKIRIDARGANSVDLTVGPLEAPRVLTFLDAYYPGWRVQVDGRPAALLRTDQQFKGVYLRQGTHRVRFEFVPRRTYLAIGISLTAAATMILLMLILKSTMRCRLTRARF